MAERIIETLLSLPAGKNPYGWTHQEFYRTTDGFLWGMVTRTARQDTRDPNSGGHMSKQQINETLAEYNRPLID